MTLNPVATAELVTREIRSGSRDGLPTKIAVASRTYATEQEDLWDAVTNSERIPRWFLPISGELEIGGRYQLEGNAGGLIERCEEPERFAVTWEFGGRISWLQIDLTPTHDGTTLVLAHEAPIDDEARIFWDQYGPGATGVGWDLGLLGLGRHLEGDAPLDPGSADDWATTPDGIVFVRRAATGWGDAAVADGDEPGPAHEAAERTITFYTVPPEEDQAGS